MGVSKKNTQSVSTIANPLPVQISLITDTLPELDDIRSIPAFTEELDADMKCMLIEGMASHFMTPDEICSTVKMTRGEFEGNLVFQHAYQRGHDMGKGSLRRMQFIRAQRDTVMQIWLGKQYLDQHDKVERVKGDANEDAYKGFLNKLTIKLDISGARRTDPIVIGEGKGDSPVHLGVVGTDEPIGTNPRGMVESDDNREVVGRVAQRSDERGVNV